MALAPMLVIGCGGSGGKVVLGLRRRLEEELRRRGWERGLPDAWQLKWIDVPEVAESHPEFGPQLPVGDYLGISKGVSRYEIIDTAVTSRASGQVERLIGWRPSPKLKLPVDKGAGQMRAVGRSVAIARSGDIAGMVRSAIGEISGGTTELAQLARHLGGEGEVDPKPAVVVVSSMAGGTGAGIFMDVCDVVRAVNVDLDPRIFGVLFTAEIFRGVGADAGMAPNTVAAVGELMSGFLAADRPLEPLYGELGAVALDGKSGPAIPLVVGMQPLGGGEPLESPGQCYRVVTETLVAATINEKFQQDFVAHQITNFAQNAAIGDRETAYGMLNAPVAPGGDVRCGVVSSFGSAVVSVGSGRFGEWAGDRLARAVLDHVVDGWREYGRQLMGDQLSPATTDQDVVEFLVGRDRAAFVDACGLWEENEPNGVEHNQVLDGILATEAMASLRDGLRSRLLSELAGVGEAVAGVWQQNIEGVVAKGRSAFLGDLEKALVEGVEEFATGVVPRVSDTVSEWLAKFGVPVTRGLVEELAKQCRTAIDQLEADAAGFERGAQQNVGQFVLGAFAQLGNGRARSDSEFVKNGLSQALGPLTYAAAQRRCEMAVMVLDRVVQRIVNPLLAELDDLGGRLGDEATVKEISSWPDDGGDVGAVYRPAPSEFVLMAPETWNREYERLLSLSAGSVTSARDVVASGGFEHGPPINRQTAPSMVEFGQGVRWWDANSLNVSVKTRLRPVEVVDRVRLWMWDENHAMGKFMRTGLQEYLSETGAARQSRLNAFETALTRAVASAKPLVSIDPTLMQRLHRGKDQLDCTVVCEQLPFPPAMEDVRAVATRVLAGEKSPDSGWFSAGNTDGVESILITSILDNAVQPAVVSSLTSPIAAKWGPTSRQANRSDSIKGFRFNNRARTLAESIPLPEPAVITIAKGWFLGRILGVISDATETEPFKVHYEVGGRPTTAALPWPVLQHAQEKDVHLKSNGRQWLPALLEQLPIAMMMIGVDPTSLDGYEQLFQLGDGAKKAVESWISTGATPDGGRSARTVSGETPEQRQESLLKKLHDQHDNLAKHRQSAELLLEWERFLEIPYGYELLETFERGLSELAAITSSVEPEEEDW